MNTSSRTPEGIPHRCQVCGRQIWIGSIAMPGDATCPHCGSLLWVDADRTEERSKKERLSQLSDLFNDVVLKSQANVVPYVMLSCFLRGMVQLSLAKAAVIWDVSDHATRMCHAHPGDHPLLKLVEQPAHARLLRTAMAAQHHNAVFVPDDELAECFGDQARSGVMLACFTTPVIRNGIVEVFQRVDTPIQARPGISVFMDQLVGILRKSVALNPPADGPTPLG